MEEAKVIVSLFVRRLRPGMGYADFRQAWYPDQGFGVPTRVINGEALDDPREIVSLGFVAAQPEDIEGVAAGAATAEAARHARIEEVIETTAHRGVYRLVDDQDFTDEPRTFSSTPGRGITP